MRVGANGIGMVTAYGDADPAVLIKLQAGADAGDGVTMQLPTAMPDSLKNLQMNASGVISYGSSSGGTVSGTFESFSQGAIGVETGQDLSTAVGKVDTWIFRNLVDAPPAPASFAYDSAATTTISVTFTSPSVYQLGILATTVPYISGLTVEVRKATSSTAGTAITGTLTTTDASVTVTGSGTNFDGELEAYDSVTVGGVTRTVVSVESDTSLTIDSAYPSAFSAQAGTYVRYDAGNAETFTLTTVDNLPRENSSTIVQAITAGLSTSGLSTGVSGTVSSKNNYNVLLTGAYTAADMIQITATYTNNHGTLVNRGHVSDLEFTSAGVPVAPTSFSAGAGTTSVSTSYTSPSDNDASTGGNQSTPAIEFYKVTYSSNALASGVVRYGGAVTDAEASTTQAPSSSSLSASQTGPTLSSLEAGQTYSVSVRAKNTVNSSGGDASDGYGAEVTDTFDTSVPPAPTLYSASSVLAHSETTNAVTARLVSTTGTVSAGNVIRLGGVTGEVNFTTISDISVNETNANLEATHHSWEVEVGGVAEGIDAQITNFQAFDSPFAYAGSTVVSAGNSDLTLSSHEDAGSGGTAGFWAHITAQLDYTATAGESQITVELIKLNNAAETSRTLAFYGDSLTATPTVVLTLNGGIADTNADKVSGVATFGDAFTLPLYVDIANVAKYFFRADKLADVDFDSRPAASDTLVVSGTTFYYFDDAVTPVSAPFSSKAVRFSKTITYDDPGAGKWSLSANVQVDCTPYNLFANGSEATYTGIHTGTGVLGTANGGLIKALYIDTVSTLELATHPTEVILTGGFSGGIVDCPAMSSSSDHGAYDHDSVLTTGEYQQSLQFTGGTYRTAQNSDAYLDYTTYYDHPTHGTLPDYSGISADGTYRYVTFQFSLAAGSTISALDITFNDANSTLTSNSHVTTKVNSYTKLWVKLIQDGDYTPHATNNNSSIWLDGNTPLSGAVGRTQTNYSDSGLEPLAALTIDSNSTSTVKRVVLATGTSTGSTTGMVVLVRVGLIMNQDVQFSSMSLTAV